MSYPLFTRLMMRVHKILSIDLAPQQPSPGYLQPYLSRDDICRERLWWNDVSLEFEYLASFSVYLVRRAQMTRMSMSLRVGNSELLAYPTDVSEIGPLRRWMVQEVLAHPEVPIVEVLRKAFAKGFPKTHHVRATPCLL